MTETIYPESHHHRRREKKYVAMQRFETIGELWASLRCTPDTFSTADLRDAWSGPLVPTCYRISNMRARAPDAPVLTSILRFEYVKSEPRHWAIEQAFSHQMNYVAIQGEAIVQLANRKKRNNWHMGASTLKSRDQNDRNGFVVPVSVFRFICKKFTLFARYSSRHMHSASPVPAIEFGVHLRTATLRFTTSLFTIRRQRHHSQVAMCAAQEFSKQRNTKDLRRRRRRREQQIHLVFVRHFYSTYFFAIFARLQKAHELHCRVHT